MKCIFYFLLDYRLIVKILKIEINSKRFRRNVKLKKIGSKSKNWKKLKNRIH